MWRRPTYLDTIHQQNRLDLIIDLPLFVYIT